MKDGFLERERLRPDYHQYTVSNGACADPRTFRSKWEQQPHRKSRGALRLAASDNRFGFEVRRRCV